MAKKLETERKFLLKNLPKGLKYSVLKIYQFYLPDGSRIRETIDSESNFPFPIHKYELTNKKKLRQGVYEEDEKIISKEKFNKLRSKTISSIYKTRHVYKTDKIKWEIDTFDNLLLITAEIELPHLYSGFKMPKQISAELIMEVTEFPQFTNKSLAQNIE